MAATIATQPVADTGAGVSDDEAQRSSGSDTEWMKNALCFKMRVGSNTFQVSFRVDDDGWWYAGWVGPGGAVVTGSGPTMESCEDTIRPRIAACWDESASGALFLETVGGREYQVRYARPGGWQWAGTWISPDGIPVTTYALTLELCQVRLRLEIAARTGGAPCE